jgi:acetyltransferase
VDGEFAVVVGDEWQGSGLGLRLMQRLSAHAQGKGVARLHGVARAGNRAMLALARRAGCEISRDADPALLRMELAL